MQLLRKISPKTVYGDKTDILEAVMKTRDKPEHIPIMRVWGIGNGTRRGENEEDPKGRGWVAILGTFRAVSYKTGEEFESGVCFLPNYVADLVAGKMIGEVAAVHFAFDITVIFDKESATSYTYGATPLLQPEADDPLAKMQAALPPTAKALPAPNKK